MKDSDLRTLSKAAKAVSKLNKLIHPLFLTQDYINRSTDIFPIEFLDMQENYQLLYGQDVLSGIHIDTKNLRFQCEQELKVKLLNLKQAYLRICRNKAALRSLLFQAFTSVLHISRNLLRLKNKKLVYQKLEMIKELGREFGIEQGLWEKILAAKLNQLKLNAKETEDLFMSFTAQLEKLVDAVDRL